MGKKKEKTKDKAKEKNVKERAVHAAAADVIELGPSGSAATTVETSGDPKGS